MKEKKLFETSTRNPLGILFYILAGLIFAAMIALVAATEEGAFGLLSIASLIFVVIGVSVSRCTYSLTITNVRITAESTFGKRIDLPVKMLTAIGRGPLSRVTAATAQGHISLYLVEENEKAFQVLSNLLTSYANAENFADKAPESGRYSKDEAQKKEKGAHPQAPHAKNAPNGKPGGGRVTRFGFDPLTGVRIEQADPDEDIAPADDAEDEYIDVSCPYCGETLSFLPQQVEEGDLICPACNKEFKYDPN